MVSAIANILKETRTEILSRLKSSGRMTVEEIAAAVGVSKVSVRRHLELLRKDGLVSFECERAGRGRPGYTYFLTDKAEALFPKCYNTLALVVLGQVRQQFGEEGLSQVLNGHANDTICCLKPQLEGLDFNKRVKRLVSLLNERGYAVEARRLRDGSHQLRQRNCPVQAVAAVYQQICAEEKRSYRELLGTEVHSECRIVAGASSCDYRIMPPAASSIEPAERPRS